MLTGHLSRPAGEIMCAASRADGLGAQRLRGAAGRPHLPDHAAVQPHDACWRTCWCPASRGRIRTAPARRGPRASTSNSSVWRSSRTLHAKNLSGGQQKLLELGRALMLDPEILFLDEPFAGVNPFLRDEIIVLVQQAACARPHLRHRRSRYPGAAAPGRTHGGDVARREDRRRQRSPRCATTRRCCGPMPVSEQPPS